MKPTQQNAVNNLVRPQRIKWHDQLGWRKEPWLCYSCGLVSTESQYSNGGKFVCECCADEQNELFNAGYVEISPTIV